MDQTNPSELFVLMSVTRAEIAQDINEHEMPGKPVGFTIGGSDPRLSKDFCDRYADLLSQYYSMDGDNREEARDECRDELAELCLAQFGWKKPDMATPVDFTTTITLQVTGKVEAYTLHGELRDILLEMAKSDIEAHGFQVAATAQ